VSLLSSFVLDNEFADLLTLPIMKIVCKIKTSLSTRNSININEIFYKNI
jgi:hypothetical protein